VSEDLYARTRRLAKALQDTFEERLKGIFNELGDPYLVRASHARPRIKSQSSLERKAKAKGWTPAESFERAEDLVGFRVVCSNLQDVRRAAQLITAALEGERIKVRERNYIEAPKNSGYRAIHLLFQSEVRIGEDAMNVGCEIQIRTLAQDMWAHLSHEDIYKGDVPPRLIERTRRLSEILWRADRVAEQIRREVVKPRKGRRPAPGAMLNRSSIAFLYRRAFGQDAPDYLAPLILREFGNAPVRADGLDQLLQSGDVIDKLQSAYSQETRWGPGPEQLFRWCVLAVTKGVGAASREAAREGKGDWKEIDRQYKSEISSSVPNDLEQMRARLLSAEHDGDAEWDAYEWGTYFDAARTCEFCGTRLVDVDSLVERFLKHFRVKGRGIEGARAKIQGMLQRSGVEDAGGSSLCSACRYMMEKDD
jgi:ppGpp synthetase/RelA/SpoT-type nucleotidyltranferase